VPDKQNVEGLKATESVQYQDTGSVSCMDKKELTLMLMEESSCCYEWPGGDVASMADGSHYSTYSTKVYPW